MNEKKHPILLGIETSCDETAAALVSGDKNILANEVFSQLEEHREFGGVVPEIAARTHMEHIERVVDAAFATANLTIDDVDAIAVTSGPGLIGGVIVGVMFAKAYASVHQKPLFAINHLEGHALTARLTDDAPFPYLMLLVSGGHCQIMVVEGLGSYRLLGQTIDDALGEAFDKVAKMMGLGYPGGPAVEALAKQGDPKRFDLPKPLLNRPDCDMSFSGLKTAVRTALIGCAGGVGEALAEQDKADMAASFQRVVGEILGHKIGRAIEQFKAEHPTGDTMVLAGGVAANLAIRSVLEERLAQADMRLVAPPISLCTDNAAMIAWAGMERWIDGDTDGDGLDVDPRARWPLTEL